MENNLNYSGIENYSQALTRQILNEVFETKSRVDGKAILELTPIRQVNLFMIKNLFAAWQQESQNIKSPYFDYENTQVRDALKNLMNILSQHISVDKEHMIPLLENAIKETILLVFSPYDFYTHQIASNESLTFDTLKSYSKYVKINEKIYASLIKSLDEEGIKLINREKMITSLNAVFEHTEATPEDVDDYLHQFSALLNLEESTIYGTTTDTITPSAEASIPSVETPSSTIHSSQKGTLKVLNDELAHEVKQTLADIHQKQKITSIEKHLSINQRYMFVKVLFNGDEDAFKATIHHLESLDNKTRAVQYLNDQHPQWDHESEEVEEFMEIVEKRLA